jgi:hypothetical protein
MTNLKYLVFVTLITISMISSSKSLNDGFEQKFNNKMLLTESETITVNFLKKLLKELAKPQHIIVEQRRQTKCDSNCESSKHKKSQSKSAKPNYTFKSSFMDTLYG